jgi:hypothetical protein
MLKDAIFIRRGCTDQARALLALPFNFLLGRRESEMHRGISAPVEGEWYFAIDCAKCRETIFAYPAPDGPTQKLHVQGVLPIRCPSCAYPDVYRPRLFRTLQYVPHRHERFETATVLPGPGARPEEPVAASS